MDGYQLIGEYTLLRYDRATGRRLGVERVRNAITVAGKNELIKLILGTGGTVFDKAHAVLKLKNGSGVVTRTMLASADPDDAAFPKIATLKPTITWQFSDISVDEYDTTQAEFGNGSVIFSTVNTSWTPKLKPRTENWIYQYQLTIGGTFYQPYVTDPEMPEQLYPGSWDFCRLMTGASTERWNQTNTYLRMADTYPGSGITPGPGPIEPPSGPLPPEEPVWTENFILCTEPPIHDTTACSITWKFRSEHGGKWALVEMYRLKEPNRYPLVGIAEGFTNTSDVLFYTVTVTFT